VQRHLSAIGVTLFAAVSLILLSNAAFSLDKKLIGLLGRDLTLTGRTDIWHLVIDQHTNPLIGVGFSSFWMGSRGEVLQGKLHYPLNEAHNGYLETYLNAGSVGVILLLILLVSSAAAIRKQVVLGSEWAAFRLAVLLSVLVYNITEAAFDRLNLVWFALLVVIVECPMRRPFQRVGSRAPRCVVCR
jgi:exopolysaccharide production protein ExoQ